MDRIASFHQHYHAQGRESAHNLLRDQLRYARILCNNYLVTFPLHVMYYNTHFIVQAVSLHHIQPFQFRIKDPRLCPQSSLEIGVCVFCGVLIFKLLHFVFYINELPEIIKINSKPVLFADNTS